jgi:hypothetical protein
MGLSVDDIVVKFPAKTIPYIQGEPNYASINDLVQMLYSNAASLTTTLGGRQYGHIGRIMTPILYAMLSNTLQQPCRSQSHPHPTHWGNSNGL